LTYTVTNTGQKTADKKHNIYQILQFGGSCTHPPSLTMAKTDMQKWTLGV